MFHLQYGFGDDSDDEWTGGPGQKVLQSTNEPDNLAIVKSFVIVIVVFRWQKQGTEERSLLETIFGICR